MPRVTRRDPSSAAEPVAERTRATKEATASSVIVAIVVTDARSGTASRRARIATGGRRRTVRSRRRRWPRTVRTRSSRPPANPFRTRSGASRRRRGRSGHGFPRSPRRGAPERDRKTPGRCRGDRSRLGVVAAVAPAVASPGVACKGGRRPPGGRARSPRPLASSDGGSAGPEVDSHHDVAVCMGPTWTTGDLRRARGGGAFRTEAVVARGVRSLASAVRFLRGSCSIPSPGARLIFRSVLAWVGVLLRVQCPVRAARRPVPARAAPIRFEGRCVCAVVRGRPEGGLVATAAGPVCAGGCIGSGAGVTVRRRVRLGEAV